MQAVFHNKRGFCLNAASSVVVKYSRIRCHHLVHGDFFPNFQLATEKQKIFRRGAHLENKNM